MKAKDTDKNEYLDETDRHQKTSITEKPSSKDHIKPKGPKPRCDPQRIHLYKCKGFANSKGNCEVTILMVRHIGVIGIYVFTESAIPINVHSDIRHGIRCLRFRSKLLQALDPIFSQSTRKNNSAQIAVRDFMVQIDSSPELNTGLSGSVATQCMTSKGFSKASKALIDMKSRRKRNLETIHDDSVTTFSVNDFKALTDPMRMSVPEYCAHANDEQFIMKHFNDPVVLFSDVDDKDDVRWNDGRWNAVVFTYVGKLPLFTKIIEMGNWRRCRITSMTDAATPIETIRLVRESFSDFRHKCWTTTYGFAREEDTIACFHLVNVTRQIFRNLEPYVKMNKPVNSFLFTILKDGGAALHKAANMLDASEGACKSHMIDRRKGIGTAGINSCGSMYRYLDNKNLKDKPSKYFFLMLNNCLFSVYHDTAHRTAILLMFKYMLGKWIVVESNGQINAIANGRETLEEIYTILVRDFHPLIPFVKGVKKNKDLVGKNSKCHLIIAWFFGFYFQISDPNMAKAMNDNDKKMSSPSPMKRDNKDGTGDLPAYKLRIRPTYGPVHVPGDPLSTNSLESEQGRSAVLIGSIAKDHGNWSPYQAVLDGLKMQCHVPDNFASKPVHSDHDWEQIYKYCSKGPRNSATSPLPVFFRHMVVYNYHPPYNLIPFCDIFTTIGRLRRNNKKKDNSIALVAYLPSRYHYERLMKGLKHDLKDQRNEFNFPSNSKPDIYNKGEDTTLFDDVHNRLMADLSSESYCACLLCFHFQNVYLNLNPVMHPDHTGIDMTKIPEMEQIGNYVYRHGSRLSNKGELAGVTPARRKQIDLEMQAHLNSINREQKRPKKKVQEKSSDKMERDLEETINDCVASIDDQSPHNYNIFQRAMGPFTRIVMNRQRVESNDENYQAYCASFYSRFFGFLVQSEDWHTDDMGSRPMTTTSEGFKQMSENLRINLKQSIEQARKRRTNVDTVPKFDPYENFSTLK